MTHPQNSRTILVPRSALPGCDATRRNISAYVTAAAAVFALVLAMAMPAHAGKKDDLAKALIAALVIGAIVNETKRAEPAPIPAPAPVSQTRVPAVCAISIEGAERDVTLYPESCMRNEGFKARLPRGCATGARIYGRDDRVYSAQCLRDAGFRTSGR